MLNHIVPANRVNSIQEYYFSKKLKEVALLNSQGANIISLGIGGPDRMPSDQVIDTLCQTAQDSDAHSYQPFGGLPQLRQAYTQWYKKHYNVNLDPETQIQPLIGSKEAIINVSLAFLNPGDGVLVPNPGYPTYTSASKLVEAKVYYYNLREDNGWQPDLDELEQMPLENIKLMWVNYPHMPTGAPAQMETFEKLVGFGRRHGIVIAHDNPYSFILNTNPLSILQVDGSIDVCLELNSLSKSHNMAGWRMGVIASNSDFINWFVKVKSNIDSGQFKPMMLAAIQALNAPAQWYQEINKVYAERRKVAEEIMTALGCKYDTRQRGLFLWGKISDGEESAATLCDNVLYNGHVFITPGFIFGSNGERYVRISLCAPIDIMKEALSRIKELKIN